MPNWELIQTTLETWFASALGGFVGYDVCAPEDVAVLWTHENAHVPISDEFYGELNVDSIVALGRDEARSESLSASQNQTTVYGNRIITIGCQVVSRVQSLPIGPVYLLERARTSLRLESVSNALINAGLGRIDISPMSEIFDFVGDRDQTRAYMAVRFSMASAIQDIPNDIIDSLSLTGSVDLDCDGTAEVTLPELEITW